MESKDILTSLHRYEDTEFPSDFISKVTGFFRKRKTLVYEISDDPMIIAGVRLHYLYNRDKYRIEISNRKRGDVYRKIVLTSEDSKKFRLQIEAILDKSIDICKEIKTDQKTFYLNFLEGEETNPYYYELVSLFLSKQTLHLLSHQNLKHYCELVNKGNALKEFSLLKRKMRDWDWKIKDRLLIYSGITFQFMGSIYSRDVDLIYVSPTERYDPILGLEKYFDIHVVTPKRVIEVKEDKTLSYKNQLYRYGLAEYVGQKDIYEMITNPCHYFHFIGTKCLDLFSSISRNSERSNAFSMVDLVMLKEYSKIDSFDKFCIKNVVIRRGRAIVNNDESVQKMYKKASKSINEWYNLDLSPEYFEKHFKRCRERLVGVPESKKVRESYIFMNKTIRKILRFTNLEMDLKEKYDLYGKVENGKVMVVTSLTHESIGKVIKEKGDIVWGVFPYNDENNPLLYVKGIGGEVKKIYEIEEEVWKIKKDTTYDKLKNAPRHLREILSNYRITILFKK